MKFKSFLTESIEVSQIEKLSKDYILKLWNQWKQEFPDEGGINDVSYMEHEFNRITYDLGKWIFNQIKNKSYIKSAKIINYPKNAVKCSSKIGRCYYNALDFMMKNGTQYGELAYAFFINAKNLEDVDSWVKNNEKTHPYLFAGLEHAVVINKNNEIIDPTLGRDQAGNIVIYEMIPETIWKNFKYKPNDASHDARDFYDDYICKKLKIKSEMPDFKKWINS